jgi:hypothetical protein
MQAVFCSYDVTTAVTTYNSCITECGFKNMTRKFSLMMV